jgi:ABC-type polysaccharide/polyol phosphate transport system ATPase subunit
VAVKVEDLGVRYRTRHEHSPTLKSALTSILHRRRDSRIVDALDGVSFDVPSGCVFGVIGRNGAGKSTLFRAIAGILPPTSGRVTVYGRVTPLLSLGVGFNRQLTGRQNVELGGLAAGLHPEEVREHFEQVIDFAALGEAIDYPMRTYSSGMFGRLGFAVAAHLNPEIILIDEALAAGDAKFKSKCFAKIEELCSQDCTVMIVSHGLGVIKRLADHAIWLEKGKVFLEGGADEVVAAYLSAEDLVAEEALMEDA